MMNVKMGDIISAIDEAKTQPSSQKITRDIEKVIVYARDGEKKVSYRKLRDFIGAKFGVWISNSYLNEAYNRMSDEYKMELLAEIDSEK